MIIINNNNKLHLYSDIDCIISYKTNKCDTCDLFLVRFISNYN